MPNTKVRQTLKVKWMPEVLKRKELGKMHDTALALRLSREWGVKVTETWVATARQEKGIAPFKKISPHRRAEIIADPQFNNASPEWLAEKYEVTRAYVYGLRRKYGDIVIMSPSDLAEYHGWRSRMLQSWR